MVSAAEMFTDMTVAAARLALSKVETADMTVPEEVRNQAWHTLSIALDTEQAWPQVRELLLTLAPKMELAGFRHDWIPFLDAGMDRSQQRNDPHVTAELHLQRGYLFMRLRDFDQAEADLSAAAEQFQALGNRHRQSTSLQRLAMNAHFQEDIERAEQLVQQAARLLEDTDPEWAYCHFVYGILAGDRQMWDEASRAFQQGWDAALAQRDLRLVGLCRFNLGRMCLSSYMYQLHLLAADEGQERCREALHHLAEARPILDEAGDIHNLASLLNTAGLAHSYLDESPEALACFAQAESILERLNDEANLAWIYHNRALEYRNLKRLAEAESSLKKAISIWLRLERPRARFLSQEMLGNIFMAQDRRTEAAGLYETLLAELESVPAAEQDSEWERQTQAVRRDLRALGHAGDNV